LAVFFRFWPYLAAVVLLIGAWAWAHHTGYESGYAASEAKWQPKFEGAERERDAANARAQKKEADSIALSDQIERTHAETIASLTSRAADAEQRTAGLVRQLSVRARSCAVPPTGSASTVPDAASASDRVADRASKDLVELARRCESDGRTLAQLQRWVTEQRAIINR